MWVVVAWLTKREVKIDEYLPGAFFCVFKEQDAVEFLEHIKNGHSQYPAILTVQVWSIMDLLRGLTNACFLGIASCS